MCKAESQLSNCPIQGINAEMKSIIDLSNATFEENVLPLRMGALSKEYASTINKNTLNVYESISKEMNEKMINQKYPDKILFTINELANELNLSYEYIRNKVKNEIIPSVKFGDRSMIHKETIIELLTYGVQ